MNRESCRPYRVAIILKKFYSQVLNDSELVDFVSAVAHPEGGGADGYYLVKNPIWRSSEDVVQLRRLERSVNLTMHESQTDNKKILDVRVHLPGKLSTK